MSSEVTVFSDRPEACEAIAALLTRAPACRGADVAVVAYGGTLPATALRHCVERLGRSYRVLVVLPEGAAAQVPDLLRAGALGFVDARCDEQEFFDALAVVARGAVYVAADARQALTASPASTPAPPSVLTPREREVLCWIANGYTHSQTARRMGLSSATVDTYVKRIRAKLEVRNKAELTRKAMELGLVGQEPVSVAA
ncbi:response regulator transcription factor [Amycolatopsis sp. NPDC059027]|uniref:helix-turn-helix transcriptional regulator n=1 Tax=unclassified Amycolatopsis TaxID=2618356 RepID=UPI00366F75FC